jgi:predicted NBD/HSP70 family sugar kinase
MGARTAVSEEVDVEAAFANVWEHFPAETELARLTGLDVIRENDAKCAALGEFWTAGSSAQDFAALYLANGIGCGIIMGGAIYRGSSGNAGEIGHIQVDPVGIGCWCGRRGCLDTVASPRAIAERIAGDARLAAACGVTADMDTGEIYRRFGEQVKQGVPELVEVFDTAAGQLADAIIDLVNTLDLDLISLSGPGFVELGEEYRHTIEQRVAALALSRDVHPVVVRLGVGGADAAALGAASVVLHRNLTPHQVGAMTVTRTA